MKYLDYMQVKTLDLLYDVFSDVLFNLTRFDTEKEIYTFHTKLLRMPNLCYIRLDENVMTQSVYNTRSEITVQCGSV